MDMVALHERFRYEDGVLYHKRNFGRIKQGQPCGSLHHSGYLQTSMNGRIFLNHRLIYAMHYGSCPQYLDHIDGNRLNNRIENLREVTVRQNAMNQRLSKRSGSGVKNVTICPVTKKWRVYMHINSHQRYFGSYKDIELADLVACMVREKYNGQFARHS